MKWSAAALLVAVVMVAGDCLAAPTEGQSGLLRSCLQYERTLTTPADFPAAQRTLLAVTLAAAEMGTTDPNEILEIYLVASEQAEDRLKRVTQYAWNETDAAWDETYRSTNTYDGSNHLTQTLWEDNISSSWVNSALATNTYDGSGRLATTTNQNWAIDHWENETYATYAYDGSGHLTTMILQDWDADAGQWVNWMRTTFTYTGDRVATSTTQMWDITWVDFSRMTYTYDGSNRLTEWLTELWMDDHWENSGHVTSTYDGNGRLAQTVSQYWQGGAWVNSGKNEYTYDGSGNEIIDVYSIWLGIDWMTYDVDSSKYSAGKLVEVVHNAVFPVPALSRTLYNYEGDNLIEDIDQNWMDVLVAAFSWVNYARATYEYEAGGTAVLISDAPAPTGYELNQNYPNPFNPSTSIRYSLRRAAWVEITVFNMLGQEVRTLENGFQAPGVYETVWDGTDAGGRAVASGVYFYRVQTGDFTETRKMILLK